MGEVGKAARRVWDAIVTGRWEGTWESIRFSVGGPLTGLLTQSTSRLTGQVTIPDTARPSTGAVSGSVDGDTVVIAGDVRANFVSHRGAGRPFRRRQRGAVASRFRRF
jgi:hypothetical protein